MHLAIDAREAFSKQRTGKGQWAAGLLAELQKRDVRLTLLTDESSASPDTVRLPVGIRWHYHALQYLKQHSDIDCYLSPTSFIVPSFLPANIPCVPFLHDLIAFRDDPHDRKATMIERLLLPKLTKKAKRFCAISDATKHDFLERFPHVPEDVVTTVYAGPARETAPLHEPDGQTILCIGTLCPRKNQLRLIRAYASLPSPLRQKYRLVLAGGRGWDDADIVRMAKNTKGVEWMGYISSEKYDELLHTATVFALPSLYEGFGMQILDALQRGIPVMTSDRGSLKEVVGNSAVLVDPESDLSIAAGLTALLENEDVRKQLHEFGPKQTSKFTWKRTTDLVLEAVQTVV